MFNINYVLKSFKNYLNINDDGIINIKEVIKEIVEDNNLIVKYKECIKYFNLVIKEGIIDLKNDFSIYFFINS